MIPKTLEGRRLVLASGSPRRRELLAMLDVPFTVAPKLDIDENWPPGLAPEQIPACLSRVKAAAYRPLMAPDEVYVTADTIVILDGEVMGKPVDLDDACAMLGRLSGRTHTVVTGVTLADTGHSVTFDDRTDVDFGHITAAEIRAYVDRCRPLDKAGAYGIQEWIGAVGIRSIRGSFYNVMGLPTHRLWDELQKF